MLRITKVDERVESSDRFKDDIATLAAIAAVWAAILDIFFTTKADRSRATGAGTDKDFCLVEKMDVLALDYQNDFVILNSMHRC